jgi:uncharacterized protein
MAVQSSYNVMVPLATSSASHGAQYYALFNTLAGVIDVVDETVHDALDAQNVAPSCSRVIDFSIPTVRELELPQPVREYLSQRGYLFDSVADEKRRSRIIYEEMLTFHRKVVRQPIVVIPSYNCDLKCPYCWQRLYHMDSPIMSAEMADHLATTLPVFIDVDSPDRVDFTIFGGEPLQDVPLLRERVLQLLDLGRSAGYSTKIISNGVGLGPNVPYLAGKVDVIQITIDGPADVHRKRRPLPGTRDSFTPMVAGVDLALKAGIRINVRVNTDPTNLTRLPELADFAVSRGWLDTGLIRFHLAPVKNHNPRKETNPESDLLRQVVALVKADPRMRIYDLSGFPGLKYFDGFKNSGMFSLHRFFNCEAQINLYVFDLHGDVYSCWDAAGLKHLAVGRYHPGPQIKTIELDKWRKRTSLDIEGCGGCTSSPHCGGGCQFLALEHNKTFQASSCDSMMEGYLQGIADNEAWLLDHAMAGTHAVGLVTARGVETPVNGVFGVLGRGGSSEALDSLACA